MSTATIQPLSTGQALFTHRGVDQVFPSWAHAVAEARQLRIPHTVLPFPATAHDRRVVEVLAVAPALRVLA
jgi:hypothetical protein